MPKFTIVTALSDDPTKPDTSVRDLDLSTRARNALLYASINTVEQFLTVTKDTLRRIPGCGAQTTTELLLMQRSLRAPTPDWEGFGRAIMEGWQEHGDVDSSDKFDWAVKFGIVKPIPGGFNPEIHVDEYSSAEPGDPWYQLA